MIFEACRVKCRKLRLKKDKYRTSLRIGKINLIPRSEAKVNALPVPPVPTFAVGALFAGVGAAGPH